MGILVITEIEDKVGNLCFVTCRIGYVLFLKETLPKFLRNSFDFTSLDRLALGECGAGRFSRGIKTSLK